MKKILKERAEQFPPDMKYDITLDFTPPIKASMEEILHTLIRGDHTGADRGLHLSAKLPRHDHPDVNRASLAAGRVHHVPGAGLQRQRADDVRPGAGHRHRRGRRHRGGRGCAAPPRARPKTA